MGKVCIVTGASRGLGRGIALVLASQSGCKVYATARNEAVYESDAWKNDISPKVPAMLDGSKAVIRKIEASPRSVIQ